MADFSNEDITAVLNTPVDPATFIPGKTDLASGTGHWTIGLPPNSAIAVSDPGIEGLFPNLQVVLDMKTIGTSTMSFVAPPLPPLPPDAIGFTGKFEFAFINDTGATLNGILLTLANSTPQPPLNLVPGNIAFGHAVDANYAYFTDLVPNAFSTPVTEFAPTGQPTAPPTGPAASTLALTGPIAPGAVVTGSVAIHNTELSTGDNSFVLMMTPV